jgi:spore coat protein U-like protein
MQTCFSRGLFLTAVFLVLAGPAAAGQATTTFGVSATVQSSCSVSAGTLAFGNYTAATGTPNDTSSTISVTCTSGLSYTVALDGGTTTSTVNARAMSDGNSHTLTYALYTTSGRTTLFGDGTSSTQTVGGTGNGLAQSVTVYGRIPVAQYVTAASYTDTVGVTVSY